MSDIFTFLSTAFPPTAQVTAFVGREALSETYAFDIALKLTGIDVDTAAAVGSRATLFIDRGFGAPPFMFHGILSSVELVNDFGAYGLYVARIVPTYWQLKLTRHNRIFTDASVPDIIEAILKEGGLGADDYRLSLWNSYPKLEHVCQYRESNYDFIARLAEREGIYFYFEQGAEREVLVFTDTRAGHKALAPKPVRYYPAAPGDVTAGDSLRSFRCKSNALPGRVRVADYNYLKPSLEVVGQADVGGKGDIVLWGENVKTPNDGARYAQVRAEELAARQTVYTGVGPQFYLRPGYTFFLEEHPRVPFNNQYLSIEVEHVGNQSASPEDLEVLFGIHGTKEVYLATVHAIPHATQFRAERKTAWPRIDGVVDGVVDGPADSPYAQIDGHGRYKVHIFFDEGDMIDGSRSTWVRMLQPHGGSVEGHHFPLRKDTEVHLVFLGGDPDRPVIVGVAHNTEKPSVVTQSNYTKNVIRTGSNNFIEMEDLIGSTHVHVYAPKYNSQLHLGNGAYNFDLKTDNNGHIFTGVNLDVDVMANKTEDVHGTITEVYEGPFSTTVTNGVTEQFNATLDETVEGAVNTHYHSTYDFDVTGATNQTFKNLVNLTVQGAHKERFLSTYKQTVVGKTTQFLLGTRSAFVIGKDSLLVAGTSKTFITGAKTENVLGQSDLTVGGAYNVKSNGPTSWFNASTSMGVTAGASLTAAFSANAAFKMSADLEISIGLKLSLAASVSIELSASLKLMARGVEIAFSGPTINSAPVWLGQVGAKLNTIGAKLHLGSAEIKCNGITLFS